MEIEPMPFSSVNFIPLLQEVQRMNLKPFLRKSCFLIYSFPFQNFTKTAFIFENLYMTLKNSLIGTTFV